MIKLIFSYFLIGLVCLFSVSAEAQTYKFTTLDYPGAFSTAALGIDANNIVGWYSDADYVAHGFLYDGTTWTTLDYPGGIDTNAFGIDGNNIVGYYTDINFNYHGFLYDGTTLTWTTLDYPVAIYTDALGIDAGNIVGSYGGGGLGHGYLYNGADYTPLDYPGARNTIPSGIYDGNIVGLYSDAIRNHGFLATPVIVIGGCNTGVADQLFDTGYKMSDLISQCATIATNHGKFVSCVDGLTSGWKKMRLITGKEKDAIQNCAAKADIP
jgi:hypothetical protein